MQKNIQQWIALDIDDTLADTVWYLILNLQKHIWNPENLSVDEIISKYKYTFNIPYYNNKQSEKIINDILTSNQKQKNIKPIKWTQTYIKKINKIVPIKAYITTRPDCIYDGTAKWLKDNWFPTAEIIMRPPNIKTQDWNKRKAEILQKLYPNIIWIIDDNAWLIEHIDNSYQGKIFLYDKEGNKEKTQAGKNREKIYTTIQNIYQQ